MKLPRVAAPVLCGLFAGAVLAQSPGPTDPAGPRLEPPITPGTGTETRQRAMDEQIERGTLIDRRDAVDGNTEPLDTDPAADSQAPQPSKPLHPR